MKQSGLPNIVWVLLGLLCISAFLISLGQQDTDTSPEAESYSPSGISAFVELLRQRGVPVSIDQQPRPRLKPNDIAVAFDVTTKDNLGITDKDPEQSRFSTYFWKYIEDGGSGILLSVPKDFATASKSAADQKPAEIIDLTTGEKFKLNPRLCSVSAILSAS